jgi:uncharacterized protein YjiS (DUF1127 family)
MFRKMRAAFERMDHRRAARLDYDTMQAMDERALRDIGTSRAEIEAEMRRLR